MAGSCSVRLQTDGSQNCTNECLESLGHQTQAAHTWKACGAFRRHSERQFFGVRRLNAGSMIAAITIAQAKAMLCSRTKVASFEMRDEIGSKFQTMRDMATIATQPTANAAIQPSVPRATFHNSSACKPPSSAPSTGTETSTAKRWLDASNWRPDMYHAHALSGAISNSSL